MNCINDKLIQKYIDSEAAPEEVKFIETHIVSCNKCEVKVKNQRILAIRIKKAINQLANVSVEIPEFIIPSEKNKRRLPASGRLYYILAAASILLFIFVITKKEESVNNDLELIEITSVMEVDANLPVTQYPLVISITDPEGNISEHFID